MVAEHKESIVDVINPDGSSAAVLVCEHASAFMPASFKYLGLPNELRQSHAVWDPGALGVARRLSAQLDATLVAGAVSRLIYDCNRPPDAADAMPSRVERIEVPGNAGLNAVDRKRRVQTYYEPFRATLADQIAAVPSPVIITIHSFTPVYAGQSRDVQIGILHDCDDRLASAMLDMAAEHTRLNAKRNQPYGPSDGVTHTLKEYGLAGGHPNVMIEIRNDLVQTETTQHQIADMLAEWLAEGCNKIGYQGVFLCRA